MHVIDDGTDHRGIRLRQQPVTDVEDVSSSVGNLVEDFVRARERARRAWQPLIICEHCVRHAQAPREGLGGSDLAPLPGARREGLRLARRLRPTSEVLVGTAASEVRCHRSRCTLPSLASWTRFR